MSGPSDPLLSAVLEIRDLIRLMAEPAVAQRDEKSRAALREIVGKSAVKARAVALMDGSKTQTEISKTANIHISDLSKLVKAIRAANLLAEGSNPLLSIRIPSNFFDTKDSN